MEYRIEPTEKYVPDQLNLDFLSTEEVMDRKSRTIEDSSLRQYLAKGIVEVADVHESDSSSNIAVPELVIEKKPNRMPNELVFGLLMDELDVGPDILYMRRGDDGDIRYGMEMLFDYGTFSDVEMNGFNDYLNHIESIGETVSRKHQVGIIHDDLVGMKTHGEWRNTSYPRNLMVSGTSYDSKIIDWEDSHFEDEPSFKDKSPHLRDMNPETRDDEYNAILSSLVVEGLISLDIFEEDARGRSNNGGIRKEYLFSHDKREGVDYIDLESLEENVGTVDFSNLMNQVRDRFETGIHEGMLSFDSMYSAFERSRIPTSNKFSFYKNSMGGNWLNTYMKETIIPGSSTVQENNRSEAMAKYRKDEIEDWVNSTLKRL